MKVNPIQWALAPAGPQAERIAGLYWVFFGVSAAVYLIVVIFLVAALIKGRRRLEPDVTAEREHSMARTVAIGSALTIVILFGLLFFSVATGSAIGTFGQNKPHQLEIDVTGHQWWWEVGYPDVKEPDKSFRTANEMHIPVGTAVLFRVATRDVIHSLWIPNLHGKRDLIPGRVNKFWVQADRPGTYRATCGEFCGLQHAHMAMVVVAESPTQFEAWKARQQTPANNPTTPEQLRGREAFLRLPCVNCHSIVGTDAYATVGPDLTHLASRATIGSGILLNTRGNLAGWVVNAPAIKPGIQMPANPMSSQDLNDLLAYLESLK